MVQKEMIKGIDVLGLMYCLKGISEVNPKMKREAVTNFNKTSLNLQDAYTPIAEKLQAIQQQKAEIEKKYVAKVVVNEATKERELSEDDKNSFINEIKSLDIVNKEKELLEQEVEVELHKVKFSLVKDIDYAPMVADGQGVKRMVDYTLIDKYNIIYK